MYTFALRPSGEAIRLSLRSRKTSDVDEMPRGQRARWLVEAPAEEVFTVQRTTISLPPKARIRGSVLCDACGEPVMDTRAQRVHGRTLCPPCAGAQ